MKYKLVPALTRLKVYYDRTRQYIGAIQFLINMAVLLILAKPYLPHFLYKNPQVTMIVGCILFAPLCIFIGWLDLKLGFFQEEARRHSSLNPIYRQILDELADIKKKVDHATPTDQIINISTIEPGPWVKDLLSQRQPGGHDLQPADGEGLGRGNLRFRDVDERNRCHPAPDADATGY